MFTLKTGKGNVHNFHESADKGSLEQIGRKRHRKRKKGVEVSQIDIANVSSDH